MGGQGYNAFLLAKQSQLLANVRSENLLKELFQINSPGNLDSKD